MNRRISIDSIMKVAKEQHHRQFILLTPQDMRYLFPFYDIAQFLRSCTVVVMLNEYFLTNRFLVMILLFGVHVFNGHFVHAGF